MRARVASIGLCSTLLLVLLLGACGGDPPPRPPPLCFLDRGKSFGSPPPVKPEEWMRAIVKPKAVRDQVIAEHDCTGSEIKWVPPPASCIVKSPPLDPPVPQPLSEELIFERMLPEDRRIVWIATHRFANGEGFGPVAVARILKNGIEVEAIGHMRLRMERVDMQLWQIEQNKVLIAAGEMCAKKSDASSCHRAINSLVMSDKALVNPPITYRSGRCIDAPWVEVKRMEDLPLETGWNRHFEITSSVTHDKRYLVITEQVRVQESDPNAPDIPPREVRRIDTERFIHVEGPRLVTRQHPLWPRILPSAGSLELRRGAREP
jgi:hypothetical protein